MISETELPFFFQMKPGHDDPLQVREDNQEKKPYLPVAAWSSFVLFCVFSLNSQTFYRVGGLV